MNLKLILCIICSAAVLTTASVALGAPRGGGGHFGGMSAPSGFSRGGMGPGSGGARNMTGHNMTGHNMSGNRHNHNGHHNGHHHGGFNNVVFIGDFGFPWWWGWGWGWGYPYGYYPYGYGYDGYGYDGYGYDGYGYDGYGYGYDRSGSDYGQYGSSSKSRVTELQHRLARAGYYHGAVDGILGPQTRAAIRAYEREHGDVADRSR